MTMGICDVKVRTIWTSNEEKSLSVENRRNGLFSFGVGFLNVAKTLTFGVAIRIPDSMTSEHDEKLVGEMRGVERSSYHLSSAGLLAFPGRN
jgi:hypothetical protein